METEKSNVFNPNLGLGLGDILSLLITSPLFGANPFSAESSEMYYESMYGKHFNEICQNKGWLVMLQRI